METSKSINEIPLLLENFKKAFNQRIQGPMKNREREFQATVESKLIKNVAKFFSARGIQKLAGISTWKDKHELKLAYHFVVKIGDEFLDTKITVITFVPLKERRTITISQIFPNARIFEEEINQQYKVIFNE